MLSTSSDFSHPEKFDLRGTWSQALWAFLLPLFIFLCFRWVLLEPFVIPSGSMIPTLRINDHLLVKKFVFGIKIPFGSNYLLRWSEPQRGDIVVFQYPRNRRVFYIKRVIGVPGDRIKFKESRIIINGQALEYKNISNFQEHTSEDDLNDDFEILEENLFGAKHLVRFARRQGEEGGVLSFRDEEDGRRLEGQEILVPKDSYFVVGDNRDQSSDSRAWGVVKFGELVGQPWLILMGCDRTLDSSQFCHPQFFDSSRFLKVP